MNPLERYLHHLGRWWWLVVVTTLAAGVVSYWIASSSPGDYRATTTLLVSLNRAPGTIVLDDVLLSERLTSTYEQLIVTRPVLDEVADRLGGPETADDLKVEASAVIDTQLIRVSAESDDSNRAALIANTVAEVFIEQNNRSSTGARPGTVSVVEQGEPPDSREGSSLPIRTVAGLLAGASLALVVIAGRAYFDNSIWNPEDIKSTGSELPCLGVLPAGSLDGISPLAIGKQVPKLTEPFQALTATVLSALARRKGSDTACQVVAVVSPRHGEGRTSIVARLGVGIALEGHRVSLMDFDLRDPSLHQDFGLPNISGVADAIVSSRHSAQNRSHETMLVRDGLRVMAAGQITHAPRPALLAHEARMVLDWVKAEEPDFILVDTPPLGDGTEAIVLGQVVDTAIIVAEARHTPAELVTSVAAQLDAMGLEVLGIVINKR